MEDRIVRIFVGEKNGEGFGVELYVFVKAVGPNLVSWMHLFYNSQYSHAPYNGVAVTDGVCIQWCFHATIIGLDFL